MTRGRHKTPYLLVLREGPTYSFGGLHHLASVLSRALEGELWTYGPEQQDATVDRFQVQCVRVRDQSGPLAKLPYMLHVVWRGLVLRWLRRRALVVIAYDPMRNGIIGVLLKYLTGARFVCEVNGVYTSDANLVDMPDVNRRDAKRKAMVDVASRVLRHADVIKLLYPTQINGYALHGHKPQIHCFFDIVDVSRFRAPETEGEKIILFVGFPFLRKGVDLLLSAYSAIRSDFPEWRLVIIGWSIEEAARGSGLPLEGVDFLGAQPVDAVASWMRRCGIFVLPSRSEGMGRVLLEAAAASRPRLASNVDGIPAVVTHGSDGLLFEPGDAAALESSLRTLIQDRAFAQRLGVAARARMEADFTEERYLEHYQALLIELMDRR